MIPWRFAKRAVVLGITVFLVGCADRLVSAIDIAGPAGLSQSWVRGGDFTLAAFSRLSDPRQPVTVYIEGDGLAWITRSQISTDPTPRTSLGLELAALDPGPNVVYLARPCQYIGVGSNPHCVSAIWSDARFSLLDHEDASLPYFVDLRVRWNDLYALTMGKKILGAEKQSRSGIKKRSSDPPKGRSAPTVPLPPAGMTMEAAR